jgi:hypothetical protein
MITKVLGFVWRFVALVLLYSICFIAGSMVLLGFLPDTKSEPGLVSMDTGLLIIASVNTLLIMILINSSRWRGLKLALLLGLAYYGVVTFMMQIETWYFLSGLTVNEALLPRLFIMTLPVAFVCIPLAVLLMGRWFREKDPEFRYETEIPAMQWVWKLAVIAVVYVTLYWTAGYFIAWQNPELRAFYRVSEIRPFWEATADMFKSDPGLFAFQLFRGLLWTVFALIVIRSSIRSAWVTALLVALLFSVPQNILHIIENPLMPQASVRLSHMIETASSTFVFGLVVTWLLHRRHDSFADLFGIERKQAIA